MKGEKNAWAVKDCLGKWGILAFVLMCRFVETKRVRLHVTTSLFCYVNETFSFNLLS